MDIFYTLFYTKSWETGSQYLYKKIVSILTFTQAIYCTSLRGLTVRVLACHAGDPGSIQGVCLYFILFLSHLEFKIASFGEPYYFGQTSYGIPPLAKLG